MSEINKVALEMVEGSLERIVREQIKKQMPGVISRAKKIIKQRLNDKGYIKKIVEEQLTAALDDGYLLDALTRKEFNQLCRNAALSVLMVRSRKKI